jgi:predicted alpha/beta hydrolase family esterase
MARYLLLHGFGGVGPDHWLVWLSTELRAAGHVARIRKLPSPTSPDVDAWMAAMRGRLNVLGAASEPEGVAALGEAGDPTGDLVVVAHSMGARLWLHHAQEFEAWAESTLDGAPAAPDRAVADRVALVAPPLMPEGLGRTRWYDLAVGQNASARAFQAELDHVPTVRPQLAARHTRMVVSGNDHFWPAGGAAAGIAEPLGLPVDAIGDHRHVEPQDGYGPWPSMLAWCLGETETISA